MRVNESELSTDDDVYMDYEVAKNACATLKKYFEVHVTMISNEYETQNLRVLPHEEVPKYKVFLPLLQPYPCSKLTKP